MGTRIYYCHMTENYFSHMTENMHEKEVYYLYLIADVNIFLIIVHVDETLAKID